MDNSLFHLSHGDAVDPAVVGLVASASRPLPSPVLRGRSRRRGACWIYSVCTVPVLRWYLPCRYEHRYILLVLRPLILQQMTDLTLIIAPADAGRSGDVCKAVHALLAGAERRDCHK